MTKYLTDVWAGLYTVLVGMKITFMHLFEKKVTVQYPDEAYPIPDIARNRLYLDMDSCNACTSCERVCPVKCITVESMKVMADDPDQPMLSDGSKRKLWVTKYEIDFAKCCFCGLCTTVCPTEAIKHTTEFEYSTLNRSDLVYDFRVLTDEQIAEKQRLIDEKAAKDKAAKEEAARKKAEEDAKKKAAEAEKKAKETAEAANVENSEKKDS